MGAEVAQPFCRRLFFNRILVTISAVSAEMVPNSTGWFDHQRPAERAPNPTNAQSLTQRN
jgi:hypothetical protein